MGRNLLVKSDGHEYVVGETSFDAEEDLHTAFEKHPQLFPTADLNLGQLMVVGREVSFESGRADLVLVDEGGEIVIAEFKRGTENPDSRRVVAQMLGYGAYLWKQSPESFASEIALPYLRARASGVAKPATLDEVAREMFGLEPERLEEFSKGILQNLTAGTFYYVVVARTLPPTLGSVLQYVGAVSRLKAAAIAVDYFRDSGDREIIVPRVVFSSATVVRPPAKPGKATPETFLEEVGPAAEFWTRFLEFLNGLPGQFYWGAKGFSYRVILGGKQYPILWGYPRTIWWLKDKGIGDELRLALEARPDQPEGLRTLLPTNLGQLRQLPGAKATKEGPIETVVLNVQTGLPHVEGQIRQALTALFQKASDQQHSG
jgi:hypothetical protein